MLYITSIASVTEYLFVRECADAKSTERFEPCMGVSAAGCFRMCGFVRIHLGVFV